MKLRLLTIGKTTGKHYPPLIDDYRQRISRYTSFQYQEVNVAIAAKTPETVQTEKEGLAVLKQIEPLEKIVLLDVTGRQFDSLSFSQYIASNQQAGTRHLSFIIGGPYGFSQKVKEMASEQISLSPMTFTHQMVRLIFLEQLYRAYTILNNEPYHHH